MSTLSAQTHGTAYMVLADGRSFVIVPSVHPVVAINDEKWDQCMKADLEALQVETKHPYYLSNVCPYSSNACPYFLILKCVCPCSSNACPYCDERWDRSWMLVRVAAVAWGAWFGLWADSSTSFG